MDGCGHVCGGFFPRGPCCAPPAPPFYPRRAPTADDSYYAWANETLWPTLHSSSAAAPSCATGSFDAYAAANAAFCAAITALRPDMVWIQDYHLFLLPALLRAALAPAPPRIGLFLHTPFCASAHWRALPPREALLLGALGADLIGFHTLSDQGHFASSAAKLLPAARVLGDAVLLQGRCAQLLVCPIGIDPSAFVAEASSRDCLEKAREMRGFYGAHPLVVSCE